MFQIKLHHLNIKSKIPSSNAFRVLNNAALLESKLLVCTLKEVEWEFCSAKSAQCSERTTLSLFLENYFEVEYLIFIIVGNGAQILLRLSELFELKKITVYNQ